MFGTCSRLLFAALAGALSTAVGSARAQEPALAAPGEVRVQAVPRFAREMSFPEPTALGVVPGQRALYVAQSNGRVSWVELDDDGGAAGLRTWLELLVGPEREGQGLIGFAPHPRYRDTLRVFAHYTPREGRRSRISEFTCARGGGAVAERVLIEVPQPWSNHNGGQLAFGPDGLLYIGLGDGGSSGDPQRHAQDPGSLLGKLLRIDVERREPGLAYGLPEDNPFRDAGGDDADGAARAEVYALGLCDPRRFSFDPEGGALWIVDRGADRFEEIHLGARGHNFGWPLWEGFVARERKAAVGPGELAQPLAVLPHALASDLIGGLVCRAGAPEALVGRYVCADRLSGDLWAVAADGVERRRPVRVGLVERPAVFGRGLGGRILVATREGALLQLR